MNHFLPSLTILIVLGLSFTANAQTPPAKNPFTKPTPVIAPVAPASGVSPATPNMQGISSGGRFSQNAAPGQRMYQAPMGNASNSAMGGSGYSAPSPGNPGANFGANPSFNNGVPSFNNGYPPGNAIGTVTPTTQGVEEAIEEVPNAVRLGRINGSYVYKGGSPTAGVSASRSSAAGANNSAVTAPSANIPGGTVYVFESVKKNRIVRKPGAKSITPSSGGGDPLNNPYAASSRPNLPSMVGTRAPNGSN